MSKMADVHFFSLPLKVTEILSFHLNPLSMGKDWMAFAAELDFKLADVRNIGCFSDPTFEVVKRWELKENKILSLNHVEVILEKIGRKDVIRDIGIKLSEKKTDVELLARALPEEHPGHYTAQRKYDVFISYSKQDITFAKEIVKHLEEENYTVCIDFRDFMPGYNYLDQVCNVIELICRKVIVILSNGFVNSEDCDFQAKVALSLSPGATRHKVIPIMYESCERPHVLRSLTYLDYNSVYQRPHFWNLLTKAIKEK